MLASARQPGKGKKMTIYGIDRETIEDLDLEEVSKDWSRYAREHITVRRAGGYLAADCTEVGAYRLAYRHRHSGNMFHVADNGTGKFSFVLNEKKE